MLAELFKLRESLMFCKIVSIGDLFLVDVAIPVHTSLICVVSEREYMRQTADIRLSASFSPPHPSPLTPHPSSPTG